MEGELKKVVILGGGTAGWMAASLMNKEWKDKGFEITLVESTDIGIVGVGEGSTPPMKEFFDHMGIPEEDWMPECKATFKNGISFVGWSTKPGFESYFHPFCSGLDIFTQRKFEFNTQVRRRGVDVEVQPDKFFLTSALATKRLAPIAKDDCPFGVNYGYHFDSALVGKYLRETITQLGVIHIDTKIVDVKLHENGDIASLKTEDGDTIEADFFVDCSGFRAYLIQKTLGVPFIDFSDNLFNDAAIAMPSPMDEDMLSETVSTALTNGWAWKIPLQNRYGNGYVYSSAYCSRDEAETELRAHIGLLDADVEARFVPMKVGRLSENWNKNCVAIGLSQGFIEPLEATGIQIILTSIQGFITAWEDGGFTSENRDLYNQGVADYFEHIRDYIVLHYKSTSRDDTKYWRDNFENPHISDSLKSLIECWLECRDLAAEIERQDIEQYYASISWHSIFAGMGIFPDQDQMGRGVISDYRVSVDAVQALLNFTAKNFYSQYQYIAEQNQVPKH